MTTPNTDLRDRIARAMAAHEGFDADHLDHEFVVGEWYDTAAALVPIVAEAVKAGKAEALRDAANDKSLRLSGHSGISITRLRDRASQIEKETPDEH